MQKLNKALLTKSKAGPACVRNFEPFQSNDSQGLRLYKPTTAQQRPKSLILTYKNSVDSYQTPSEGLLLPQKVPTPPKKPAKKLGLFPVVSRSLELGNFTYISQLSSLNHRSVVAQSSLSRCPPKNSCSCFPLPRSWDISTTVLLSLSHPIP
jgi:hypothetical protein